MLNYKQDQLVCFIAVNNEGLKLPFIALVERSYYDPDDANGKYNVECSILESKIINGHIIATNKFGQYKTFKGEYNFIVFSTDTEDQEIGTLFLGPDYTIKCYKPIIINKLETSIKA